MLSPKKEETSWSLDELQDWQRLICYGRPGWGAMWKVYNNSDMNPYSFESLINLAERKLMAGFFTFDDVLGKAKAHLISTIELALLSRRVPVIIGENSEIARSMVASCMGICTEVSKDLKSLRVDTPSEPILSEAAARVIGEYRLWPRLIEALLGAIRQEVVDSGKIGEVASWILLAMTWDAACIAKGSSSSGTTYTRSDITVADFLKAMMGETPIAEIFGSPDLPSAVDQDDQKAEKQRFLDELLQMRICFTHSIQFKEKDPSFETLATSAVRMGLGISGPNAEGADAHLPLFAAKGDKKQRLWLFQFQIKNQVRFPYSLFKKALARMRITSRYYSPQDRPGSLVPGIDMVLNIGHEQKGRCFCKFYIHADSERASLELSTDSNLTLFRHVIEAVTRTDDVTKDKAAADNLASLMARLIDSGRKKSGKRKNVSLEDLPSTVKEPLRHTLENLMDVYNL